MSSLTTTVDTSMSETYYPTNPPSQQTGVWCHRRSSDRDQFETVLTSIVIHEARKNNIRHRYIRLLDEFQGRALRYSISFYVGHSVITFGSLIVPALMSIQYSSTLNEYSQQVLYWLTWVISLLVTTFNAILVLFKVDKKYYSLHTTLERLRSEGWQYIGLTGRYSGILTHYREEPTHDNQYKFFCHYVEKIKLKQVEDEYYKYDEVHNLNTPSTAQRPGCSDATKDQNSILPPSLNKDLPSMSKDAPQSVRDAIHGLIIPSPDGFDSPSTRTVRYSTEQARPTGI